MNTYEFWNEMDKILDAIVAYQEKTIEFNKRFITPWIKLGNVFDKQESKETIVARQNAIEIDPENAENWYELAGAYIRAGNFQKSIQAYQKTLSLGFESGELYKNLALAHAMTNKYQQAVPLFEKSLDLYEEAEEKAVVWNHLGNTYRKLDNYEMALQAFQKADQFEVSTATVEADSTEENSASKSTEEPAPAMEAESTSEEAVLAEAATEDAEVAYLEEETVEETVELPIELVSEELKGIDEADADEEDDNMPVILELDFSESDADETLPEEVFTNEVQEENLAEEVPVSEFLATLEKEVDSKLVKDVTEEKLEPAVEEEINAAGIALEEIIDLEGAATPEPEENIQEVEFNQEPVTELREAVVDTLEEKNMPELEDFEETLASAGTLEEISEEVAIEEDAAEVVREDQETGAVPDLVGTLVADEQLEEVVASASTLEIEEGESSPESVTPPTFSAYDEYLKDNNDSATILPNSELEEVEDITMPPAEVEVTSSDTPINVNADMSTNTDTKNAHVWNELGNVYFNANSFDDAVAAYRKAIELDKQFAWPYTNLALSYVQQGRLNEAVLLYQRGIELFTSDKDKAVAWNRLGNVYRRMNEYEKAIAAYQRADELDTDNIALTQQSRFSLLGSEKAKREIEYSV